MAEPTLEVTVERLALGQRQVLRDVHFTCQSGTHTAIIGPNGAGKTTLLRAILGLVPLTGQVLLGGQPAATLSAAERARAIAYVPQRSLLQASLSVADVVMLGRYAYQRASGRSTRADLAAVARALELTDTEQLRDRRYPELSGGEQRRVLLARALATEARIIALDEPTTALDLSHQLRLFAVLKELVQAGQTVLTVLHDLRDAERWCDQALVLHGGTLEYVGPPALPDELVTGVYGVRRINNSAASFELEGVD